MATTTQTPEGVTADGDPSGSHVSRNRLLVGLAIVSLILAAFLLPPLGPAAGSGPDGGPGNGTTDPDTTPEDPGTETESDRSIGENGDETGDATPRSPRPGDGRPGGDDGVSVRVANASGGEGGESGLNVTGSERHPDCFLVVWDRLVPGREATVVLWNDGGPATNQPVWFEDHVLGETSASGRVDGEVPYVRELRVTAGVPPVESCGVVHLDVETDFDEWQAERGGPPVLQVGEDATVETVTPEAGNVTTTLPVEGEADLTVAGEPYPGEEVRLNATVAGEPMGSGAVRVDGERVGETDDHGHYDLTVPDDGTDRLAVSVTRGEFSAEATVDVLLLSVDLGGSGLLALPGDPVDVRATVGDRPASDVRVEHMDASTSTGADGHTTIRLSADPRDVVTVSGYDQTATAPVWPLYAPTVLALLVVGGLVAGSLAGASRRESGPGVWPVAAVWGLCAVLVAAWVLAGPVGAGLVALVALGGVAMVYRESVGSGIDRLRNLALAAVLAVHGLALALADGLGLATDWLYGAVRGLLARLRGLPRSLRPLLRGCLRGIAGFPRLVGTWLVAVSVRLGEAGRRVLGTLVAALVTPRGLAAAGIGAVLVGVGWYVADAPGGLGAFTAVLAGLGVLAWRRARAGGAGTGDADGSALPDSAVGDDSVGIGASDVVRRTLRQFWRTFARRVVPGQWRTRTPGEVARVAVDRGLPREPVEQLTEAFREVEYGDRTLTDEELGRARSAFEALRSTRSDEEGGDS